MRLVGTVTISRPGETHLDDDHCYDCWYAKSFPGTIHRLPLHQEGAANCSLLNLVAVLLQHDSYQLTARPDSGFRK